MTTYLDELVTGATRRVAAAREQEPLASLRARAQDGPGARTLYDALSVRGVSVIAEVKRASPSKGPLAPDMDAATQARHYLDGGAAAISVLTEPEQFLGSLDDLSAVARLGAPTLRKDFIVDPYQIWEAKLAGASAVLLIVAALDERTLQELHDEADAAGLTSLVEVHDASEVAVANRVGARVVGVNARDLRTFALDRDAFARLRPTLAAGTIAVAESGVRDPEDVHRAAADGADAVLVGETLVTAEDPASVVAGLVAAGLDGTASDGGRDPGLVAGHLPGKARGTAAPERSANPDPSHPSPPTNASRSQ
ncbi:MAG: indole-3-glycerol phosphate synthase TrpC [Intrasporangiaceae bacterium]|nr:indole-3-glycerol phosphate synthase TrpC [Intrasporangiaceae bacterium]